MVSDKPASPKKIKVVDRRWFNESGELRTPRAAPAPEEEKGDPQAPAVASDGKAPEAPQSPREGSAASRTDAPAAGRQDGGPPRVRRPSGAEFSVIVDVLAQQAAVLLTGAQGIERNPAQARLFIDLLDLLQEKTEGRLAPEEARYLRDVLAQLQLAYVESGS